MNTPPICHTFWDEPFYGMPEPYQQLHDEMQAMNPNVLFYVWDKYSIEELGLDYQKLLDDYINNAGVSNVVRLHAVLKDGGIWMDTDFKAHKPLDLLFAIEGAWAAEQEPGRWCNAIFGAPPNHPWIAHQIATMPRYVRVNAYGGVDNMNDAPREGVTKIPAEWVYSYRWDTPIEQRSVHPDAIVSHLWAGTWLPNKH
jgi:mannosyltransferase OCH1-like enzyme